MIEMFKRQDDNVYRARRAKLALGKKKSMRIGTRNSKPKFKDFELYSIEMDGGKKVAHIYQYSWANDGKEDGDYTVTEYTWCKIPLKDLVGRPSDEIWDIVNDAEASVHQYERDMPWEDFVQSGYATTGRSRYLPLSEITMDTPCGDYYYFV